MKFACISDLHGNLPDLCDLDYDVLLIGGDICPSSNHEPLFQAYWLDTTFRKWLTEYVKKPVIAIAGNHDWIFQTHPQEVPDLPWTYLEDSGTMIAGLKVWGSPWQKRFYDWAFNTDEAHLKAAWDKIPEDTDIFLLHGPAYGLGDFSPYGKEHTGSPSLRERIDELKPKLVIYGHIHSGYGRYQLGPSIVLNASLVNEKYRPVNAVQVIELADQV
jgi:Icc-related predicted phosphoesterase